MTYDDIAAVFLGPLAGPVAEPDVEPTPARRLRDALEPIATQGWWSRPVGERLMAMRIDFLPGYVWGRAAALGTPTASVVAATFGVFESTMIGAVYEAGVATVGREEILAARADGAAESLDVVATAAECASIAGRLLDATTALDGLGRPLFSGLRGLAVPDSSAGQLWRAAELVREHRGDGHLAALVAAGLDAAEANVLTELWLGFAHGEYSGTRGFTPQALALAMDRLDDRGWVRGGVLTELGRAARAEIEVATDRSQQALVDLLSDDLDGIVVTAGEISRRLVEGHSFPADPRKRAGG